MQVKTTWKNHYTGELQTFLGVFNSAPYTEQSTFPQYESVPKYHEMELVAVTVIAKEEE